MVKVTEIDDQGRINLSRRDSLIEVEGLVPENDDEPQRDRRPRRSFNKKRDKLKNTQRETIRSCLSFFLNEAMKFSYY